MKKIFLCSLIRHNGIIGGLLSIESNGISFKTNKITIDRKYKNFIISFDDIDKLTWKWILFSVATFHIVNGEQYKFIIFNKRKFNKYYNEFRRFDM